MAKRSLKSRLAVEGEIFLAPAGMYSRALLGSHKSGAVEVHAKGTGDEGQWFCITCCVALWHNMEKDTHAEERAPRKSALVNPDPKQQPPARHVFAWRSFKSGRVEVP
jgi:hypothetical protein